MIKRRRIIRQKTYELAIPVKTTWIFRVVATSKKEAFQKYQNSSIDVHQICDEGGWPYGGSRKVIQVLDE